MNVLYMIIFFIIWGLTTIECYNPKQGMSINIFRGLGVTLAIAAIAVIMHLGLLAIAIALELAAGLSG